MATYTRQPFAEIGTPRLQALQSAKNKQNALSPNFSSSMKPTPAPSTGKRQRAPEIFEDVDSENMDPSVFNSPSKKSRTTIGAGFVKPAKFSLFTSPAKPASLSLSSTPTIPSVRKALSSPNTAKSTPIANSRGSPKNKHLHAVSKRRASSSPFRRVDPPSFSQSSPTLPFSIDAALSGSIPTYTPKATTSVATPASAPAQAAATIDESMPKGWFFEIHEDTPEQEAANLMEHSAAILDISSDDDVETKKRNEELERGKENVPPPEFLLAQSRASTTTDEADASASEVQPEEPVKRPRLRKFVQDAMDEDRRPLGDLPASEFYGEGCDASSYVTVDVGIERPSRLSKEYECGPASPGKKQVDVAEVSVAATSQEEAASTLEQEQEQVAVETLAQEAVVAAS